MDINDALSYGFAEMEAKGLTASRLDIETVITTVGGSTYKVLLHACIEKVEARTCH